MITTCITIADVISSTNISAIAYGVVVTVVLLPSA